MPNGSGTKGIDVRQTGTALVFRNLLTASGNAIGSGTNILRIIWLKNDSTVATYDFTTNTFKTSGMSNGGQSLALTKRTILDYVAGDSALDLGFYTAILSTLTAFSVGEIYVAFVTSTATGVDTPIQSREFQYGLDEGDLGCHTSATGLAYMLSWWDNTTIDFQTKLMFNPKQLYISNGGSTSPIIGTTATINPVAPINGAPCWLTSSGYPLWFDGTNWRITNSTGVVGSGGWISSGNREDGTWSAYGTGFGATAPIIAPVFGCPPIDVNYGKQLTNSNGSVWSDIRYILGTLYAGTVGKFLDLAQIANPTQTLNLSGTTIAGATAAPTTGDFTATMKTSLNAATPASIQGVTFPTNFGSTSIDSSGRVLLQPTQTAAVIGTVTNVTNAPTAGDFTATMKTSLNSSTPGANATQTAIKAKTDLIATNSADSPATVTAQGNTTTILSGVTATFSAVTAISVPTASANATAVWAAQTSTFLTSGSVGAYILTISGGGGGGGGDPWPTVLPGSYAVGSAGYLLGNQAAILVQALQGSVTLESPVPDSGDCLSLILGDDHYNADAKAVGWTITSAEPSWVGASIVLTLGMNGLEETVTGTIVTTTGSSRPIRFDVPGTVTIALGKGSAGYYKAKVLLANGHTYSVVKSGILTITN